jgi:delta24-sterol reductase
VPWSYGTLGFLVSAEIQIIPAKKYVRMEYFPALSRQQMIKRFEQETMKKSGNDFVECLVYSETSGVIMTGIMTDDAEPDKVKDKR